MTNGEEYLSSIEAQKLLKVSRNTLLELRNLGLPFIRIRRKVLYRRRDIDEFMKTLIIEKAGKRRK